jgi:hypothetical protein
MAPELPTDEKADVYALGVVAYEMLTGKLPKRGTTAREILQHRGPDSARTSEVRAVAQVVARALASTPEERFDSTADLGIQLEGLLSRVGPSRSMIAAIAVVVAAVMVAALIAFKGWFSPPVREQAYAVFPLTSADGIGADQASALRRQLGDAIARWRDVEVIDGDRITTAATARRWTSDPAAAAQISASMGAKFVVIADATLERDTVRLRATLYDTRTRAIARRINVAAPAGQRTSLAWLAANRLLRDGTEIAQDNDSSSGPSLKSWREYDVATRVLADSWDIAGAETHLRQALQDDPNNVNAAFWLSRVLTLGGRQETDNERRALARRAFAQRHRLQTLGKHVEAAFQLASDDFGAACASYRSLVSTDSTDTFGWLGLGDCNRTDPLVVEDARSPSGFGFRGSYQLAATAYRHASRSTSTGPAFHGWLLSRLSGVLFPATYRIRVGYSGGVAHELFLAYPSLEGDTIATVPYRRPVFASGIHDPPIAKREAAITRSRTILKREAEDWVRTSPRSAAAFDSLAVLTEMAGDLANVGARRLTALELVREGRRLSSDSIQQVRLALDEIRLQLKASQFAQARKTADSLLRATSGRLMDVKGLAGVAALVGNLSVARDRLVATEPRWQIRDGNGAVVSPPQDVSAAAAKLLAYSAFGPASADSASAYSARVHSLIASYFPDTAIRKQADLAMVMPALSLQFPRGSELLARLPTAATPTYLSQQQFARGNRAEARATLSRIQSVGNTYLPGSVAIDGTYAWATLQLQFADTAGAVTQLDRVLEALPTLGVFLLEDVPQVCSLVRAMALRAQLARRLGDRTTERRWSAAVHELWDGGDPGILALLSEPGR